VSPVPTPDSIVTAAANTFDMIFRGGVADLRRTPAVIVDEAPKRVVYRYLPSHDAPQHDLPVLLVPPLAAPTISFDLRRGCSLAEHFIAMGHPTYLVEYGSIAFVAVTDPWSVAAVALAASVLVVVMVVALRRTAVPAVAAKNER